MPEAIRKRNRKQAGNKSGNPKIPKHARISAISSADLDDPHARTKELGEVLLLQQQVGNQAVQQKMQNQLVQTQKPEPGAERVLSKSELDEKLLQNYSEVMRGINRDPQLRRRYLKYLNWYDRYGPQVEATLGLLVNKFGYTRKNVFHERNFLRTTLEDNQGKVVLDHMSFEWVLPELKRIMPKYRYRATPAQYIRDIVHWSPEPKFVTQIGSKWLRILKNYSVGYITDLQLQTRGDFEEWRYGKISYTDFDVWLNNKIQECLKRGEDFDYLANQFDKLDDDLRWVKGAVKRASKLAALVAYNRKIVYWHNAKAQNDQSLLKSGDWCEYHSATRSW